MKIRAPNYQKPIPVCIREGDFFVQPATLLGDNNQPVAHYIVAVGATRCQISVDYSSINSLRADWTHAGITVPSDSVSLLGRIIGAMLANGAVEEVP